MTCHQQSTYKLLTRFYHEQKLLADHVNRRPKNDILSNPIYFRDLNELSHKQARELTSQIHKKNKAAIHDTLINHPFHKECLLRSEFIKQALFKKYGYAGDKDLMLMICNNQDEGETNYDILKNRVYLSLPAAQAVRNRVLSLYRLLTHLKPGSKVLSVGCGPALEVQKFLKNHSQKNIQFDLVDHDINTVQYLRKVHFPEKMNCLIGNAFHIIKGKYKTVLPKTKYLSQCDPKKDFKGIQTLLWPMKYKGYELKLNSYDLVYTAGLFDYIKTFPNNPSKGTTGLTKRLFDLVKPGGTLIIGNFLSPSKTNPHKTHHKTMMELYSDWNLLYRSQDEIMGFTNLLPKKEYSLQYTTEHFDFESNSEQNGAIGFLVIKKTVLDN